MRNPSATLVAVATLLAAAAACASAGVPPETAPPEVIARARQALADAGIRGELTLVASQPAEWPDSSLGCPRPGLQYLQVITAGYALRFADTNGRMHGVHVAGRAAIVCEPPLLTNAPKRAVRSVRAQPLLNVIDAARQDLAQRLNVAVEEVRVLAHEPITWPDENLGCDASHPPGPAVQGFRLTLTHRSRQYTYHADSNRAIACPPIEAQ